MHTALPCACAFYRGSESDRNRIGIHLAAPVTSISSARSPSPVWVGWALGILSTFSFSVGPPIARAALLGGLHPTALLVVRMGITAALLLLTIGVTDRSLLWTDRRCLTVSLGAGLANSLGMAAYFWALTRLTASISSMLFSVGPLVVLVVLALRGEPVTRRHWLRMALALGGIYFLIGPGGEVDVVGVLLIAAAVASYVVQVVGIHWYLGGYDARTVTFYMVLGMALGLTVVWLVEGAPWVVPDRAGWAAILALAVVCTYLARLALFGAVRRLGGGQVAMLLPTEILLTVVWSFIFLNERLTPVQWVGGVLILTSALLAIERLGRPRATRRA